MDSNVVEERSESTARRSERQRQAPVRYGFDGHADTATVGDYVHHIAYHMCEIVEPKTMEEALRSENSRGWKSAADSEYASLVEIETWELVELPCRQKAIRSKWVFKVKNRSDGRVDCFKGHLVAKGYSQTYGIDYSETFSPVVWFSSIRVLLAFAVQNDMLIHQMDIETAF